MKRDKCEKFQEIVSTTVDVDKVGVARPGGVACNIVHIGDESSFITYMDNVHLYVLKLHGKYWCMS